VKVNAIGWGAGTKEFPELPNLLRVVIGEMNAPGEQEEIVVVETNIDDMNPQIIRISSRNFLASGAHDAYLSHHHEKGRPGILLSVMTPKAKLDAVSQTIYSQTSTIGLRIQSIGRRKLQRREIEIQTQFGTIKAKAVLRDGKEIILPEFEDCKRIAEEKHLSVLDVMRQLDQELSRNHNYTR